MPQMHRSVEAFEAQLDLATRSALVAFPDFEVFKRCVAPVGGFAHTYCECVCGPTRLFRSDGWDMVARKRGSRRIAFAGTARLFASWSEIVCPREAYKLVNTFAVNLWRFANADTDVAEPDRDPVVPQPGTAVVTPVVGIARKRLTPPQAEAGSSDAGAKQRRYECIDLTEGD